MNADGGVPCREESLDVVLHSAHKAKVSAMKPIDLSDVRMVLTPSDLERIGRFRYAVYVEEQGKSTPHADHRRRTLIEPEDRDWNSRTYWVEREGRILGTVRAQRGPFPPEVARQMRLDAFPFDGQSRLALYSRLMVAQQARHTDVVSRLIFVGVAITTWNHLCAGVMTCLPALVPIFEKLGCAAYAEPFVHADSGVQQPMALLCEAQYLRERGSPVADWVDSIKPESPHSAAFLALIEGYRTWASLTAPLAASRLTVEAS